MKTRGSRDSRGAGPARGPTSAPRATGGRGSSAPGKRTERPAFGGPGKRTERPAFGGPGKRTERPSFVAAGKGGKRGERPSFGGPGKRTERPSFGGPGKRTERPSFVAAGKGGKRGERLFAKPGERGERRGPPPGARGAARHAPKQQFFARPEETVKKAPRVKPPLIRPMAIEVVLPAPAPARIGDWLFTTRPDAERDLLDELAATAAADKRELPRLAGPALVASEERPRAELTFARQGFPVRAIIALDDHRAPSLLAEAIIQALPIAQGRASRARGAQPFAIDAWVPDDDRTNPQSQVAEALGAQTAAVLRTMSPHWAPQLVSDARGAWQENGLYAQICVAEGRAYVGVTPAREAPSLAPGGRLRIHLPQHAPSRAAAKLLEAFAWLDRAPEPGEMCVDLGAAPGGWTWVLLERHARVLAIDPGRLDPIVAKNRGLTHLRADAFTFEPEEAIDWLVADMAWRPLEAAALYGKWARRGWARLLVANIKLPMKKKAEYLARVRDILTVSGWQNLRTRQLYHDREEVTVAGVRL